MKQSFFFSVFFLWLIVSFIFKKRVKFLWLQLLRCEYFPVTFLLYDNKLNMFEFEDVTLGWSTGFTIFWQLWLLWANLYYSCIYQSNQMFGYLQELLFLFWKQRCSRVEQKDCLWVKAARQAAGSCSTFCSFKIKYLWNLFVSSQRSSALNVDHKHIFIYFH